MQLPLRAVDVLIEAPKTLPESGWGSFPVARHGWKCVRCSGCGMYFPLLDKRVSGGSFAVGTDGAGDPAVNLLFDHLSWSSGCLGQRPHTAPVEVTPVIFAEHLEAVKAYLCDEAQYRAVLTAVYGRATACIGIAGTGKTHTHRVVVTTLMLALGPDRVLSACSLNLAGQKLPPGCRSVHSLACMGGDDRRAAEACIAAMSPDRRKQWIEALSLCIDETFRLGAGDLMSTLGKLDVICRILRRRDEPFGGLLLFVSGDPIQLMSGSKDSIGVHFLRSSQFRVSA